jgi:hypothetical protein
MEKDLSRIWDKYMGESQEKSGETSLEYWTSREEDHKRRSLYTTQVHVKRP